MSEASNGAETRPDDWLLKKLMEENSLAIRTVWDLYLKFYTIFLIFNITAFAATVQYVRQENRFPIVVVFIIQNVISAGTAVGMTLFSSFSTTRFDLICKHHIGLMSLTEQEKTTLCELSRSPSPGWLGIYGGAANFLSHLSLIVCWIALLYVSSAGQLKG